MRKVTYETFPTGGVATEHYGKFHAWVTVWNVVKAVVEKENGKITLIDYPNLKFLPK